MDTADVKEYRVTALEVPSGKGTDAAKRFNGQVQETLNVMAQDGWRLVNTESEVYVGRTTWLRLFWERDQR